MKHCLSMLLMMTMITLGIVTVVAQDESTPMPSPAPLILNPLLGLPTQPPFTIELPDGWELVLRDTFMYKDLIEDSDGALETLPIDVYRGPIDNGDGWIVMLWGYDSIVPFDDTLTREDYQTRAAWLNGLRMLQFVVFDEACNIGTSPRRTYSVGGLDAIGTTFNVIDCPYEMPDTRGWFAALNVGGLNFSFFVYADPIQAVNSDFESDLQQILDHIEFDVESITVTQEEFNATQQALILTPRPELQVITPTPIVTQAP